jgi:hypothetical protein
LFLDLSWWNNLGFLNGRFKVENEGGLCKTAEMLLAFIGGVLWATAQGCQRLTSGQAFQEACSCHRALDFDVLNLYGRLCSCWFVRRLWL